jgi:hypothetical protein
MRHRPFFASKVQPASFVPSLFVLEVGPAPHHYTVGPRFAELAPERGLGCGF